MVLKIHNLDKWSVLAAGEVLELPGRHLRTIRVEVNCEGPTKWQALIGEDRVFLGLVTGHEIIEFMASGEVSLVPLGEHDVWFFTNDGDRVSASKPNAVSFVGPMNRKVRNPSLEKMMFKMQQNMTRRLARQEAEMNARLEAKAASLKVGDDVKNVSGGSSDADGGTGEAEAVSDGKPSSEGQGEAPASTQTVSNPPDKAGDVQSSP